MKSRWVDHKGYRVFIADFSNFGTDSSGLQAECDQILSTLGREPVHSVFSISDAHGTVASPANLNVFKNMLPASNKYIRRRAVVGVTGARRAFIDLLNKLSGGTRFQTFDTFEQALDWIVLG